MEIEGASRHRVIRCLGRGANGVVHEAEDLQQGGRRVALKTLQRRDPEALMRLKCEFWALADVRRSVRAGRRRAALVLHRRAHRRRGLPFLAPALRREAERRGHRRARTHRAARCPGAESRRPRPIAERLPEARAGHRSPSRAWPAVPGSQAGQRPRHPRGPRGGAGLRGRHRRAGARQHHPGRRPHHRRHRRVHGAGTGRVGPRRPRRRLVRLRRDALRGAHPGACPSKATRSR